MNNTAVRIFGILMLVCLAISSVGSAGAKAEVATTTSNCPPLEPMLLKDPGFMRFLRPECQKAARKLKRDSSTGEPGLSPLLSGGPDQFGYTFNDTVPYSWINATSNTGLTGDDASTGPFNIGFKFPFYGINQTQLFINTNGGIAFGKSYDYYTSGMPYIYPPNNFIAVFSDDLAVGSPYNNGGVYYSRGGTAPNRFLVISWSLVDVYGGSSHFSFQAILHENGDIVFQYQSLPDFYDAVAGIENSIGDDGLLYLEGQIGFSPLKSVRFYYPTASIARVFLTPSTTGTFAFPGKTTDLALSIANTGSLGADTYDLTRSSTWPVTFLSADGTAALTDTDQDGAIDTGSIPQGQSRNVIARFTTPATTATGDKNNAIITVTSSRNVSVKKTANLSLAVPAEFVNVFEDDSDTGAMSFMTVGTLSANTYKASPDEYYGSYISVIKAADGNYFYAWSKYRITGGGYPVEELEYTKLDPSGNVLRPVTKLVDHSAATVYTYDRQVSLAATPDGKIGMTWARVLYNPTLDVSNYNVYFATLDGTGNLLTGPTSITNNTIWGTYDDYNVPSYYDPTIASTDDNHFILGWEEGIFSLAGEMDNIWYAVRSSDGTNIKAPIKFTSDNQSYEPFLNPLAGGKVILTWQVNYGGGLRYAVLTSNGAVFKGPTDLNAPLANGRSPDAVSLSNGKVAVAWPTTNGVQFSILDANYNIEIGPVSAVSPGFAPGEDFSVTTDASNHVIMTWNASFEPYLLYALGSSAGTFLTEPMPYKLNPEYMEISHNGQGNARYVSPVPPAPTVPAGWVGGVSISADQSIVAVGRPHVGAEVASYDGFPSGSLTSYVPMLFKNAYGGTYNSALYVQNVNDSSQATITIKYYDSEGVLQCTKNDTIQPLSSKGYWMPTETCNSGSLPSGWVGGAVVTSDRPIVAVGRPHVGSEVMTYDGFTSGSLKSYIPMLFKSAYGGSYNSAFYIQNVNDGNKASITIRYYDDQGVLKCTKTDAINPLASKGYWVPTATCDTGSIPAGWVGGVIVTSDQPVVGVGRPHIGTQVTTYNGFTAGGIYSYIPMLFKGAYGGSYNSAFYLQNANPIDTADVTILYYSSTGTLNCTQTDRIAPLASRGYWVPSVKCDTGSLPSDWVGGVVVSSTHDIVGVGRPHVGAQVTTYNGFMGGSSSSFLPMLFKGAYGGSYNSAFYVQNTAQDNATVTLKFYDTNGGLSCVHKDTIPPFSTQGYWVPSVTCTP
jgi:hypothetical protein